MRYTLKRLGVKAIAVLGLGLSAWMSVEAQSLTWLGVPYGNSSVAVAVSNDGKIVVGRAGDILSGSPANDAYLWNLNTNTVVLLTSNGGTAFGLTPDGSKVAGMTNGAGSQRAFVWTEATGSVLLPGAGYRYWAICITPDGSRAGGGSYVGGPPNYPAIWDVASNPPQLLRVYSDRVSGEIWDFSDDGSVALCFTRDPVYRARIWRLNGLDVQQEVILAPYGSDPYTLCFHLSADGSIAVGNSGQISNIWDGVGSNYRPAMWRAATNWQVEPLATLGGQRGTAWDINAGVIVGFCSTPDGENRAVRWRVDTATTQVEDLNVAYASLLGDGSVLRIAYGISPNGRFIVGAGYNAATGRYEAFLLDTMVTVSGNVELRDFGGDVTQVPVSVELRQGGNVVSTRILSLGSNGNYTFATYPGTYDLAFKASHWLRTVVPGVSVSGSSVTVNVSLTNGDIDGDNEIGLGDFSALVAAFGSTPGELGWNPEADLDGDEEVGVLDFSILLRNFGAVGEE